MKLFGGQSMPANKLLDNNRVMWYNGHAGNPACKKELGPMELILKAIHDSPDGDLAVPLIGFAVLIFTVGFMWGQYLK